MFSNVPAMFSNVRAMFRWSEQSKTYLLLSQANYALQRCSCDIEELAELRFWRSPDQTQVVIEASQAISYLYPKGRPHYNFYKFAGKHKDVMTPKHDVVKSMAKGSLTEFVYTMQPRIGKGGKDFNVLTLEGVKFICENPMPTGNTKHFERFLEYLRDFNPLALIPVLTADELLEPKELETELNNTKPRDKKRKPTSPIRWSKVTPDQHNPYKLDVEGIIRDENDPEVPEEDDNLPVAYAQPVSDAVVTVKPVSAAAFARANPADRFIVGPTRGPQQFANVMVAAFSVVEQMSEKERESTSTALKTIGQMSEKEREATSAAMKTIEKMSEWEHESREKERKAAEKASESAERERGALLKMLESLVAKVVGNAPPAPADKPV